MKEDSIMIKATTMGAIVTLLLLDAGLAYAEAQVGIKAGDWIKCEYVSGGNPPGDAPQWVKVECLSVTGTTATLHVITHFGSGAEQTEIMTWDVSSGVGNMTFQALIQANAKTGDTVKVIGGGTVTIAGEKTGTYAGASRTVVYAILTQGDTQFSCCWDRETGVLVEIALTQGSTSTTYKATNTNMWQASSPPLSLPTLNMPIEMLSIGISVAAAIAIVATAAIYTKHKRS
jgi:hypothetical protein